MGLDPRWRKEYETVICVGSCTQAAGQGERLHLRAGLPAVADDLYDTCREAGRRSDTCTRLRDN